MKWLAFVAAIGVSVLLGRWLTSRPRVRYVLFTAIAFLPFYGLEKVTFNPISYELYRGDSRGIEVTLVDVLILALALALPPRRAATLPFRPQIIAYFTITTLSVLWSFEPLFAVFSVWKLMRMVLLFATVSRGCEDDKVPPALLRGLAMGIVYELLLSLEGRYLHHLHQVMGNFPHQNTLGMAVNLVVPAALAMRLAGSGGRLALPTLASGALCIVFTLSRGAMSMFALGAVVVFGMSTWRRPTAAKFKAGLIGLVAALSMLAYAWKTIVDRFTNAPKESAEGREQFEAAASLMLKEHPLGVGMNQFSLGLGDAGYGARVGVYGYDATGIVHNIYWLTAAELGYAGALSFIVLMATPPIVALRASVRARHDVRGDVLVGLAVGLVLMDFQGKLEWAFRQTTLSYLFWIIAAVIAGLSRALTESGPAFARGTTR